MTKIDGQIDVSADGATVWVNSLEDGSCIGRFSKKFGIDVHTTGTQQLEGGAECLYCTHEPAGKDAWDEFCASMLKHHGVEVPADTIQFASQARKIKP